MRCLERYALAFLYKHKNIRKFIDDFLKLSSSVLQVTKVDYSKDKYDGHSPDFSATPPYDGNTLNFTCHFINLICLSVILCLHLPVFLLLHPHIYLGNYVRICLLFTPFFKLVSPSIFEMTLHLSVISFHVISFLIFDTSCHIILHILYIILVV